MNTGIDIKVSAIAAVAMNNAIGYQNKIPWQGMAKGEQDLFKTYTMGKIVIMGRNTWESIPDKFRPLPLRLNIVVTTNPDLIQADVLAVPSLADALILADSIIGYDEAVLIGGQRIYTEGLEHCDTLYLTRVEGIYPGDTYFPKLNKEDWATEYESYYPALNGRTAAFTFKVLRRIDD